MNLHSVSLVIFFSFLNGRHNKYEKKREGEKTLYKNIEGSFFLLSHSSRFRIVEPISDLIFLLLILQRDKFPVDGIRAGQVNR